MKLTDELLDSVAQVDWPVRRVCVGLHWTIVESKHTGMAHTYKTGNKVELESSGNLVGKSALELAQRLRSWEPLEASLGVAALNSLIEPVGNPGNVFEDILGLAAGKTVTVIGRFPSNDQIAQVAGKVYFLEMEPQAGELPPSACEEVIPESDIVVITATALINKTLPRLLELSRHAAAIVLGPSTPMNDVLFRHGADILAGVRVTDADALISSVMQGVKRFKKLAGIKPITRLSADR
ncbi:MAG: DUF364 domain-containing protein [Phycisphaerae bacterium]|nr:DUF364 domain-containing protein [Phycisphaerae bacterium]